MPPYLHRQGFVPRSQDDFGDGGAFPEVHIAQYPLHMGEPGKVQSNLASALFTIVASSNSCACWHAQKSQAVVAVGVGADGGVDHTAIVKQNRGKQKVHASFSDLVEKRVDEVRAAKTIESHSYAPTSLAHTS